MNSSNAKPTYKVVIEVSYEGEEPDPSALLDSIQDNVEEFLSPYGETVSNFEVCVNDQR